MDYFLIPHFFVSFVLTSVDPQQFCVVHTENWSTRCITLNDPWSWSRVASVQSDAAIAITCYHVAYLHIILKVVISIALVSCMWEKYYKRNHLANLSKQFWVQYWSNHTVRATCRITIISVITGSSVITIHMASIPLSVMLDMKYEVWRCTVLWEIAVPAGTYIIRNCVKWKFYKSNIYQFIYFIY